MTTEPPTRAALWREWAKWVLGVPVVVAAALAVIWGLMWLSGGQMMPRAEMDMGTALFWIAAIALMYPVAVVFLTWDLRDGLRARARWEAMTPDERAALAAAAPTPKAKPKRRARA